MITPNFETGSNIKQGLGTFDFIKKHYLLIFFLILILPVVIGSIREAVHEGNPTKPLFDLSEHILTADKTLEKQIKLFDNNMYEAIGMEKQDGLIKSTIYYWKFFWFIFNIFSLVSFIFLPLTVIYQIFKLQDSSKTGRNIIFVFIIFLIYLLVANCIITTYDIAKGNETITLNGSNPFSDYLTLFLTVLPFHGLFTLGDFLIRTIFIE